FAERGGGVEDFDLNLAVGLCLQVICPRLDHVDLKKARRPEEVAELERDGFGHGGMGDGGERRQRGCDAGEGKAHDRSSLTSNAMQYSCARSESKGLRFGPHQRGTDLLPLDFMAVSL